MSRVDIALGNERLLQLAEILETADERHIEREEPTYHQGKWAHACGTPACALGHWAANNQDRWFFAVDSCGLDDLYIKSYPNLPLYEAAQKEFGLSLLEEVELFGRTGCGHATSAKQAAKYIREFVAKRQS